MSASCDHRRKRLVVRAVARTRNHVVRNTTAMPEPNASRGLPTRVLSTAVHEFGRGARPFSPKTTSLVTAETVAALIDAPFGEANIAAVGDMSLQIGSSDAVNLAAVSDDHWPRTIRSLYWTLGLLAILAISLGFGG
jgi:hypothetical protein